MSDERHSFAERQDLITEPVDLAKREVENGIRQFELMSDLIRANVKKNDKEKFSLRPRDILRLHQAALSGINASAGAYRNTSVMIGGSSHAPPDHYTVAEEVAEACRYVNENWEASSPLHLAAYVLWKLNWIHPFADGNGRTARAVSYAVMSIRLDGMLPGAPTIPEQIAANKGPYYDALEMADRALEEHGRVDVSELEAMLSNMLAKQLMSIAVLSETSADRLVRVLDSRIKRAPREKLEHMFGTADLEGRLWPMSLDQVAYQVAAPDEVRAAEDRLAEHQSPFPGLLATPEDEGWSRSISKEEEGILLWDPEFDLPDGTALRLEEGTSIGLTNPSVSIAHGTKWYMRGGLYIARFGKGTSPNDIYDAIDLLIAKHISR